MPVTDPHETDETPAAVEDDDEPLRWWVIAAFVVTVVAGFGLTAVQTVAWYSHCDEGKHVQPYVAGDSLRGSLCDSGTFGAGLLVPGAWLLGLGLATLALARWGGGRLRLAVLAALFAAPLVLPPAAYAGLQLSSTTCSGDKMKAYRAWVDDGSKGSPPYQCRTF